MCHIEPNIAHDVSGSRKKMQTSCYRTAKFLRDFTFQKVVVPRPAPSSALPGPYITRDARRFWPPRTVFKWFGTVT